MVLLQPFLSQFRNAVSVAKGIFPKLKCLQGFFSLPYNAISHEGSNIYYRKFHSNHVCCKYHDLKKARITAGKKRKALQARLDRLDKEDRPTGCILCPMKNDITIDYKVKDFDKYFFAMVSDPSSQYQLLCKKLIGAQNVRLLSQFISPHTGRIYGATVTGLCEKKQKEITKAIQRARSLGYMPTTMKYFEFHNDPKIF